MTMFRFLVIIAIIGVIPLQASTFTHVPPDSIYSEQPLLIELESPDQGNYQFKCFYKFNESDEYSTTELIKVGPKNYQAEIMSPKNTQSITYFFWVYKDNAFTQTIPEQDHLRMPFTVFSSDSRVEYFNVLSPSLEKEHPYSPQFLFILRNNFPKNVIFKSAYLNEDEALLVLSESRVLMSLQTTFPVRRGRNTLVVNGNLVDGTPLKQTFYFKTEQIEDKRSIVITGKTQTNHLVYMSGKENATAYDPFEMQYSSQVNIKIPYASAKIYGLYDNRESKYQQTYTRLSTTIQDATLSWKANIGDVRKSYSELSLNGRRVRGSDLTVDLFKMIGWSPSLKLNIVKGQTNRAIAISSGNVSAGTYQQNMVGYQVGYSGRKAKTALQYIHVLDDKSSITSENAGTTDPIENHILSWVYQIRFTPLSRFSTELAGSIYYSDVRAPTIDVSKAELPEGVQNILDNHLPMRSSMSGGVASKTALQFPLFSKQSILKAGYEYIHPGYTNVLNTGIESDKFDKYIGVTQKLLDRKWILSMQYNNKNNNLLGSQSETTYTNGYRLNSILQTNKLGAFNTSVFVTKRNNIIDEGASTSNIEMDNQLNFILCSLSGIPIKAKGRDVNMNLSYSISNFLDFIDDTNGTKTTAIGGSISSKYKDYKMNSGLSQSISKSNTTGKTKYITLHTKLTRSLIQKVLKMTVKFKVTSGQNNHENDDYKVKNAKFVNGWDLTYYKQKVKYFKKSEWKLGVDIIKMVDSINASDKNSNYSELYTRFKVTNRF